MNIQLLHRDDIDIPRWNGCVHHASNSKVYGYAWYLDNVADEWWGLVEDNYHSVMPLVWNSKFGIKQLYVPFLCQQLGVFSVRLLNQTRIQAFLEAIPDTFKRIHLALNDGNTIQAFDDFTIEPRANYLLNLHTDYDNLAAAYSTNLKRNIKKAEQHPLTLDNQIQPEQFVALVQQNLDAKGEPQPEALYHAAHRIIYNCLHRGIGVFSLVRDADKEICAGVFFIYHGKRVINLLNFVTPRGREVQAMPFLLDRFIQKHADKPMHLDFEGSMIEGVARFYKSFGAENMPYYHLRANRLPFWMKWLKPN